jgi:hypothetical protein
VEADVIAIRHLLKDFKRQAFSGVRFYCLSGSPRRGVATRYSTICCLIESSGTLLHKP